MKKKEIIIGYRIGEPEIGEVHCAFRDQATLKDFIDGLPENNLVDLYKVIGIAAENKLGEKDDGSPDGLVMLVLQYEPFKFVKN
ncbi:MAG: hypothetical protein AABW53_01165 [Nanoarchaeota archaeon]